MIAYEGKVRHRRARLLEIKGENPFKTQAYERGASEIENYQGEFDALVKPRPFARELRRTLTREQ
jgi:DNA polymerase/3'-5' exonuclease PolX